MQRRDLSALCGLWCAIGLVGHVAIGAEPGARGGVTPTDAQGKPLNLGFESGTLADWKLEGEAFVGQPIVGDTVAPRGRGPSGHEGKYWIGGYEKLGDSPQGTLTSVPFKVTQPWGSFLVAGGPHPNTRVEIVNNKTGAVILKTPGDESENLKPAAVDLREHVGQEIFIRLVDQHSGGWGHLNFDDFRFHETKPNYNQRATTADHYAHSGLTPTEAAKEMTVPPGFAVSLFAGEPDVHQPIAMAMDDRGRLWIAEAYAYPMRVPDDKARDRILIYEDVDQDGHFDKQTVFADKLNLVSGMELGHGGVWVGAAPQLLFIPDRNGDDQPDGPPEVVLDGWGYGDTHETLNTFMWGPDGWLYGCHGVFTHSNVGKPGAPDAERQPIDAGIWRFHPTRRVFEVFAHGTSNPWGVDFNDHGQAFLTACVIPHLYQIIQGGRYERQAGTHFNPYTFDDIKTIAKHRHYVGGNPHGGNGKSDEAGGGHAHAGAMIYLGGTWPAKYRDQIFMNNIHGARINQDALAPQGSGYVGDRAPDFLRANDTWSQILNLAYGPDGQVYMIDWYDANQCHHGNTEGHDRTNGRIFKVSYQTDSPAAKTAKDLNLKALPDAKLVELQLHENDWYVRHARRVLAERAAAGKLAANTHAALAKIALAHADDTRRLRGLWALHVTGGLTPELALRALEDASPYVRGWAIQLSCESGAPASPVLAKMAQLAKSDPSPVTRLYLASAVQRLPLADRGGILSALVAHAEDSSDHNLPLMYWYAVEAQAAADPNAGFALLPQIRVPQVRGFLIRRLAHLGTPEVLGRLIKETLVGSSDRGQQIQALAEITRGLEGGRRVPLPAEWTPVSASLLKGSDGELRSLALTLGTVFGDPEALAAHRATLLDQQAAPDARLAALAALRKVQAAGLAANLQSLLKDKPVRGAVLKALADYDDPATPAAILALYGQLDAGEKRDALATLAARVSFARQLLAAVGSEQIPRADLSADAIRQLRNLKDKALEAQIAEVWGAVHDTPADKAALMTHFKNLLSSPAKPENAADAALGRALFAKTCQQCHTLFGTGGKVGPELTGSNRANLDYMLSNIVDPSALIGKDYQAHIITTSSGRVLTGLLRAEDDKAVTLVTADETIVIPKEEIDERVLGAKSMMPDDLLKPLSEREVRSLVAYLASPAQTPLLATPDTIKAFFNGRDLALWQGEPEIWSVDNGEIVGKTPGIGHNSFLKSDLQLADFRLTVDVKLVKNEGNSGIQFRSDVLPDGEVRGYQADVGGGWWGKLYEENGRGMLFDKSGEQHVKSGEWNTYVVEAVGSRLRTSINGQPCVDLDDPAGARAGRTALQMHAGGATEVRFKNFKIELLGPDGQPAK